MATLEWFSKYPKFIKELKQNIDSFEKDYDTFYTMDLSTCLLRLTEVTQQVRRWGKILVQLRTYEQLMSIEFDAWCSDRMATIRDNLIENMDQRKKLGKSTIPWREGEIKTELKRDPEHQKYSKIMARVKSFIDKIETEHFWPSNNSRSLLEAMSKFAVASEKKYD